MPSKNNPFAIRGLTKVQLAKMEKLSRYGGQPGRPFFEQAVWWWRPLLGILGEKCKRIPVPAPRDRLFFPESVFADMREAQGCGDLHELLNYWFDLELRARLVGVSFDSWPAFTANTRTAYFGLSSAEVHTVQFMSEIDLRKPDDDLCIEFRNSLKRLRDERRERFPWPVDDRIRKSSFLSEHTFARIELVDRRKSLNETVVEGAWANVNKAVRSLREKFSILPEKD